MAPGSRYLRSLSFGDLGAVVEVVKQIKTPAGKLCGGEKALSHVLVGKRSEVFPFHLVAHQLHWICLLVHLDQGEPGEGDIVLSLLHGHQNLGWMRSECEAFLQTPPDGKLD